VDSAQWFSTQLQVGAEGFTWAVEQLAPEHRTIAPPGRPDEWPAIRHAFHMLFYEQNIALPTMRQWLGGPQVSGEGLDEDLAWNGGQGQELQALLAAFRQVRAEQVAMLPLVDHAAWEEPREALWGIVTLRWVVTKTYQHTCEHTHDVLRMALWWSGRPTRLGR
jgi:hypothetical protein